MLPTSVYAWPHAFQVSGSLNVLYSFPKNESLLERLNLRPFRQGVLRLEHYTDTIEAV